MTQLVKKFIGDNEVGGFKIRLENNNHLRSRNAANDGDVNVVKVDTDDLVNLHNVGYIRDTADVKIMEAAFGSRKIFDSGEQAAIDIENKNLINSGNFIVVDWEQKLLNYESGSASVDWQSGALNATDASVSVDYAARKLYRSDAAFSADWEDRKLVTGASVTSVDWASRSLHDSGGNLAMDYENRYLKSSDGNNSVDFQARQLYDSGTTGSVAYDARYLKDASGVIAINWAARKIKNASATDLIDFSGANLDFQNTRLTNIADPTSAQDAVNLQYLDARMAGLKPKEAVRVATLVNGTLASDFEDGDVIDGITLATGDRILIKDQTAAEENGIYIVQASGAPVRSSDFNSLSPIDEINGAYTGIEEGTQAGQFYVVSAPTVAVLDTDPINFVFFNAISTLITGDGLSISGVTLDLVLDGSTLSKSPSGLKVATGGITNNEVNASAAIARSKLASGSANYVVINNGSGVLSEEAQLAVSRGGTGTNFGGALAAEDVILGSSSTALKRLAVGSEGYILKVVSGVVAWAAPAAASTFISEQLTLNGTDITNQYKDLGFTALSANGIELTVLGGLLQERGVAYSVSLAGGAGGVTRITFLGDLATGGGAALVSGDKLAVSYEY